MYNIDYIDKYLDVELDKAGSDYFSLPVKFIQFKQATYDLILEAYTYFEVNQIISDEIKPLIKTVRRRVQGLANLEYFDMDPTGDPVMSREGFYIIQPGDYKHFISLTPYYRDRGVLYTKVKKTEIVKQGQEDIFKRSPYRVATEEYPHIFREGNIFRIEMGSGVTNNYKDSKLVYVSEPVFCNINNPAHTSENSPVPAVELPKDIVDKIVQRTANSLRFIAGDPSAASNYQFKTTFGKRNR